MQFFVNGQPAQMPGGMPGGIPGMMGNYGQAQVMEPIEIKRSYYAVQKDNTFIPAAEWDADEIAFFNPAPVSKHMYDLLSRGLGSSVERLGSLSLRIKPANRPKHLIVRFRCKGFKLFITLVQEGAKEQVIPFSLGSTQQTWQEWCSEIARQIIQQSK